MRGIDATARDLRWAIRGLRKRPTYTAVAIATLALGIGANTAVLTLARAHFLTPLPYERPDDIVLLWETRRDSDEVTTISPGNYFTWREEARTLADVAAFNVNAATVSGEGTAERVGASVVTPNFFEVLGVPPLLGTAFDETGARAADGRVALLSHGLWTRRYGADPDVVGADIRIDGNPHTVLGVLSADFRQPERSLTRQTPDLWRPLMLEGQRETFDARYLRTVARLAPGATVEQAREEMAVLATRMGEAQPEHNAGRRIQVWTLHDYLMGDARPVLAVLLAAAAAVLLIVCANVANLTLARGQERAREFALRAALGSGRRRLIRQVLVESVVLAIAGAGVGAISVYAGRDALQLVQERFFTSLVSAEVDLGVLLGTALTALAAGVLFGMPLALSASRTNLRAALGEGGERAGRQEGATRNVLIVSQVAMATTLVVVALLLMRSFNAIVTVPPGFTPAGLLTFGVSAPPASYAGRDEIEAYLRDVRREVERIPGVGRVTMVSDLPFTGENRWAEPEVEGVPYDPTNPPRAEYRTVSPEYFEVMGIPTLAGGLPDDGWASFEDEAPVAVNERLADLFWPEQDPLGRRFTTTSRRYRVAAVVGDVLDDGFQARPEPLFYQSWGAAPQRRMTFVLETSGGPEVSSAVRSALRRVDPDIPAADLRTLTELMAETVVRPRAASLIGGALAVIALLVAATGIFGVLSFLVQSRTREIGIRSALGASGGEILGMVMRHSTRLLTTGLVIGVLGAVTVGRALSATLYDVRPWDPVSLGGAVAVLAAVGTLAAWLPARRAVRVDPREALRAA